MSRVLPYLLGGGFWFEEWCIIVLGYTSEKKLSRCRVDLALSCRAHIRESLQKWRPSQMYSKQSTQLLKSAAMLKTAATVRKISVTLE